MSLPISLTIVVEFSQEAERSWRGSSRRSSLTHASEKAVESYFALFHLLLRLAAEQSIMVQKADSMIDSFLSGKTHKKDCPSLGLLLVTTLISNSGLTENLTIAIIKEAVVRNVV